MIVGNINKKPLRLDPMMNNPRSNVATRGMVIPSLIGNPYNRYNYNINPYYWVDDHPLLYVNNESLDSGTYTCSRLCSEILFMACNNPYTTGEYNLYMTQPTKVLFTLP